MRKWDDTRFWGRAAASGAVNPPKGAEYLAAEIRQMDQLAARKVRVVRGKRGLFKSLRRERAKMVNLLGQAVMSN